MHKIYTAFFTLFFSLTTLAQQPVYFASQPTLSPDAATIVFCYAGDMWQTGNNGSPATRLTAMQGDESNPHISPDGKWLAFSSGQFGDNDVFVMPMAGGEIRQLTFGDSPDDVDSWSPDSRYIYFNSPRYNNFSEYKVPVTGGTPVRLFGDYFNTVHGVAESALTGELFFSSTWESIRFAQRKHYKGAYNPDIQSYNPKTKQYKKYTDWQGKDFWTSVDRNGNVYFASDEGNGEYNLYTFLQGKKTALTRFETSIKRPSVSFNGQKVVFEKDYQIHLYDVASGKAGPVQLPVFRNNVLPKQQEFNAEGKIEAFDVSADGKKLAFVSRGEIFVSDVEGKFIRKIERGAQRAVEVRWLADNRTLLYNETLNGYLNLYTIAADGSGLRKQLTADKRNNRMIVLNKKRSLGLYLSGRDELRLLDLGTLKSRVLARDEFWGFQNSQPRFSPDDQYALYTTHRNFEQDVMVCNLKTGWILNLTKSGISESSPFWSPDGKSVFFSSSRTTPSYPYGARNPHIYRLHLVKTDAPYRADKLNELFKPEEKKADSSLKKGKQKKALPKKALKKDTALTVAALKIDTVDLMERLERISANFGSQDVPFVIKKDEKLVIYYLSDQTDGKTSLYCTTLAPFEEPQTAKVNGVDTRNIDFVQAGNKYYALFNGRINTFNVESNKAEALKISFPFFRNLDAEFRQMFAETWAGLEENYYDGQFHGVNWQKMKERYAAYLPYLNNRGDLRLLLNDMLGELNSSHMGFYSTGDEESTSLKYRTMEPGIVFDEQDPLRVNHVLKNSAADKEGTDIKPGDVLVSVNGQKVNAATDRNSYFTLPVFQQELLMTFSRGGKILTAKVHPETSVALRDLMYDEWISRNRQSVSQKSGNRVSYVYMKNMSGASLEKFMQDMVQDAWQKDALILDLRYNTGGNVHDPVLQFLSQKPYLQWQYRDGRKTPQPNFAPAAKPIILLMNEQTLSDGEMTAEGFKALKLGRVVGTETYRWIIFTSGKGLVDGSFYRIPAWGCFTLDGRDIEKEGVKPDIAIQTTFTDRLNGADPQLDRAVTEIMMQLKK